MEDQAKNDEVIDLEEYAGAKHEVPKGRRYRIRVDRERFIVDTATPTGSQILIIAGKDPKEWQLNQRIGGQVIAVGNDEVVDLTTPGIERFVTLPIDQNEGA